MERIVQLQLDFQYIPNIWVAEQVSIFAFLNMSILTIQGEII